MSGASYSFFFLFGNQRFRSISFSPEVGYLTDVFRLDESNLALIKSDTSAKRLGFLIDRNLFCRYFLALNFHLLSFRINNFFFSQHGRMSFYSTRFRLNAFFNVLQFLFLVSVFFRFSWRI